MTTGIIELNDSGLRVSNDKATLLESPGFALIADDKLTLGDSARRQARLQPSLTHNQFWQRLNLEPLAGTNKSNQYRHNADLVFAHLKELHQLTTGIDNIIFAIPGSFDRVQLALLLGIARESKFNVLGLVDNATAALSSLGATTATKGSYFHVDLQLHQSVITRIDVAEQITRGQVDVVPSTGITSLYDAWAKVITKHFIQQTRFDPLHTASSEQTLYNKLPDFLEQCRRQGEATLELEGYKAAVSLQALQQQTDSIFQRLQQRLQSPDIKHIYFSDRWHKIPGLIEQFDNASLMPTAAVTQGCLGHEQFICTGHQDSLHYITQLPALDISVFKETKHNLKDKIHTEIVTQKPEAATKETKRTTRTTPEALPLATHLLYNHRAYALNQSLYLSSSANTINISPRASGSDICSLKIEQGNLAVDNINTEKTAFTVNDKSLSSGISLRAGDIIARAKCPQYITAICVQEHGY